MYLLSFSLFLFSSSLPPPLFFFLGGRGDTLPPTLGERYQCVPYSDTLARRCAIFRPPIKHRHTHTARPHFAVDHHHSDSPITQRFHFHHSACSILSHSGYVSRHCMLKVIHWVKGDRNRRLETPRARKSCVPYDMAQADLFCDSPLWVRRNRLVCLLGYV